MEHVPPPLAVLERHQLGHAPIGKHTYRDPGWRVTFPAALPARYRRTPSVADLLLTQAVLERVGVDYHLIIRPPSSVLQNKYTYSHTLLTARLC